MGAKNLDPIGIRTTDLPIHGHPHLFYYAATDFILATSFTSEH